MPRQNSNKSYEVVELPLQKLFQKIFLKYDLDGNKRISKFQFINVLKFFTKITKAPFPELIQIEDIFVALDVDGDETITLTEFQKLIDSITQLLSQKNIKIKQKRRRGLIK